MKNLSILLSLLFACVQAAPRDTLTSHGPVQITSVVWNSSGNITVEYKVGTIPYKRISSWSEYGLKWYNEIYVGKFMPRHVDTIPDTLIWKELLK